VYFVGGDPNVISTRCMVPENYSPRLAGSVICVMIKLGVLTEHLMTDGQADRQRATANTALT